MVLLSAPLFLWTITKTKTKTNTTHFPLNYDTSSIFKTQPSFRDVKMCVSESINTAYQSLNICYYKSNIIYYKVFTRCLQLGARALTQMQNTHRHTHTHKQEHGVGGLFGPLIPPSGSQHTTMESLGRGFK